jgi:hypothetical protein
MNKAGSGRVGHEEREHKVLNSNLIRLFAKDKSFALAGTRIAALSSSPQLHMKTKLTQNVIICTYTWLLVLARLAKTDLASG